MMFALAAVSILAAAAVPQLTATLDHMRTLGAARYVAGRLAVARSQAVARSANVALLITTAGESATIAMYVDGNGNGVRMREIDAGGDRPLAEAVSLGALFPSVVLSINDPAGPSQTMSALMSFTPLGTSSSGTLYMRGRDGTQYAVRVLGATGRTRVLRYAADSSTWVEVF